MATENSRWLNGQLISQLTENGAQNHWLDGQPIPAIEGLVTILTLTGSTGIVSGETFGSAGQLIKAIQDITGVAGIETGEGFGGTGSPPLPGIVAGPITGNTGIASALAFGAGGNISGQTILGEDGTGIASEEAFGADGGVGSVGGPLVGVIGIVSGETFGVPSGAGGTVTGPIVGTAGIETGEVFGGTTGSPLVPGFITTLLVGAEGIPSEEFFPTTGKIYKGIAGLIGIPSQEAFGTSGAILSMNSGLGNFSVFINGALRTVYLKANTLSGNGQLNFKGSLSFELIDTSGTYNPQIGEPVVVYYFDEAIDTPKKKGTNEWYRRFGGSIYATELRKTQATDTARYWTVQCNDYAQALTRRILNQKFPTATYGTLESIMTVISELILEPEGIHYIHRGNPPVTFPDIEFSYTPMNEVLDRLAEICGWEWQLDNYKNLYVYDRPSQILSAPFDVTQDTTGPNSDTWTDLRVSRNSGLYRNRQYMKNNFTVTSKTVTKTFTCPHTNLIAPFDGYEWALANYASAISPPSVNRAPFLVDYDPEVRGKVQRLLYIKHNGVELPLFTQASGSIDNPTFENPPAGWKWMQVWQWDLHFVYNMLSEDPSYWPKSGDTFEVSFEVANDQPPQVVEDNTAEIITRQGIEGGTGLYESVEEISDASDRDLVVAYAQSLLAKFSVMGLEIDFRTLRNGLEPGQELTVDLPGYSIASQLMNVESISYRELSKRVLTYDVKVSNQIQQRDAMTAFHRLMKKLRKPAKQYTGIVTWDLAVTYPGATNLGLQVGSGLGNAVFLRRNTTLDNVLVFFKTAPTGANIRIRIRANGVSIFPSPGYIEYSIGQRVEMTFSNFVTPPLTLVKGTKLEIDVLQIGSDQPGKDGTVHLTGWA